MAELSAGTPDMPRNRWGTIDQTSFDSLLEWLDEDRNRAGERYVRIMSSLLTI
jgi:hypothetical protein